MSTTAGNADPCTKTSTGFSCNPLPICRISFNSMIVPPSPSTSMSLLPNTMVEKNIQSVLQSSQSSNISSSYATLDVTNKKLINMSNGNLSLNPHLPIKSSNHPLETFIQSSHRQKSYHCIIRQIPLLLPQFLLWAILPFP